MLMNDPPVVYVRALRFRDDRDKDRIKRNADRALTFELGISSPQTALPPLWLSVKFQISGFISGSHCFFTPTPSATE